MLSSTAYADSLADVQTPITTAARYLDRFVRTIHPVTLVKSVLTSSQKRKGAIKTSRWRREQVERLLGLIEQAEQDGCTEALVVRARLRMVRIIYGKMWDSNE